MLTFPPDVDDYPTPHFGSDPPCWSKNDSLIDVQNSSIYYPSSPSLLPYSSNFAIDNNNAYTDSYGPSPPGTAISTSSNSADASSTDARSPTNNSKTYSFVALPGNAVKKRPRRRYDEIERLYQCSWPDCTKAYGTLNHLNAHVTMQKHGQKRSPNEFKEIRKQWRKQKKEQEAVIAAGQANLSRRTSMSSLHSEDDLYQSMVASYLDDDLSDVDYRHSQWGYSSTRSSLGNDYISSLPSQPTQPTYHHLPPHHHHHYRQSLSESSSSFSSYSSPSSSYSSYSQYDRLPQNSPLFTPLPGFGTDSGSASREQAPSLSSPPSLPPLPSISSLPPLQTQPTSQMGYGMDTIALEDSCSSQPSHPRSLLSPLPAELQNKYQLFEYDDQPPPPYALQPPAETAQTGSERGHGNAHHTRIRHSGDGAGGAGGGIHGQNEPGHSTRKFGHSRSRAGSFGSSASDSSFSRHDHELHDQDPGPGFVVPTLALDTSVSSDHVMAEPSISIGITPMPPALQMTPPSPNPSIVSRSSVYCDSIQDRHPNVPTISVSNYDGLTNFELESTGCPGSATLDVAALDVEVDVEMVVDELEEKEQDTGGRFPAVFRGPKSERYFFSSPAGGDAPKPAIDSWVSDHVLSPELLTDVSTKLPFKSKLISMDNLGFGSWSSSDYVMGFMKVDGEAIRHAFALLKPILSIGSAKESWAPTSILLIWDGITPKESQTSVQSHAFFHLPDTGFNMKALYSVLRNSLPAKVSSITPSSRPLCRPQLEASEGCYTRKYWAPHIGICAIDPRRLAVRSSHHGTGDNAVILSPRKWLSGSRCGVNSNEELIWQVWDLDELITPIVLPKPTPSTNDCIPLPAVRNGIGQSLHH
ncbi:hypothetical protein D9758_011502 [Tetrapyrgos nigripes]|uniref:C2H2-type domain-containing protein n=1 Tax=Tetrapyrgos nigripes TaxID=182062 RepID=A0A8H5CQW9_9AGAR|nr:hypothetical protein D9758_011502 [Tetrapyrgos nigripes]